VKRSLILVAAGLALVLAAPFISAEAFRGEIQKSLEMALSRKVQIAGKARFQLLPVPGFSVSDVTIAEDPAFSLEPFAYVASLEVQPRLLGLLRGRFEPSRLRLVEPSVNLMRGPQGWNVQSLAGRGLVLPDIEVRNGRLNFKQQDEKSAFFLANALLDISAPSARGEVEIFASAEPSRTDRGTQGFGRFSLRGQVRAPMSGPGGREPELDLQVELEPSALHAFNFFFGATGADFAGKLSSRGRVKGPLSQAAIEGSLHFESLDAKGFLPFGDRSHSLAYSGRMDFSGQRLQLDTKADPELQLRLRARDIFQRPKGGLLVALRGVELEKLLDLGREANAKMPAGIAAKGRFAGVVGYQWPSAASMPAQGMLWFEDASLTLPDNPVLGFGSARVIVEGPTWRLPAADIAVGESQTANMSADWNVENGALRLAVNTQLLSMKSLKTGLGLLLRASSLPLLSQSQGGSWQGSVVFERQEDSDPGSWSGRLSLRNALLNVEGLPERLEISSAAALFDANRVAVRSIRASMGSLEAEGDFTYYPASNKAAEFQWTIAEASATDLERVLRMAQKPSQGLLDKMRFRRTPSPDWLRARNLDGTLLVKNLDFAGGTLRNVPLRVRWRGEQLKLSFSSTVFSAGTDAEAALAEAAFEIPLWRDTLDYAVEGTVKNWPLAEGGSAMNFQGKASLRSLGADWEDAFSASGTATASPSDAAEAAAAEAAKFSFRAGRLSLENPGGKKRSWKSGMPVWPLQLEAEP
jgi:hypothetical protein